LQLEGEDENDGWGLRGKSRWILLFIFSLYLDTRAGKRGNPSLEAPRMSDSHRFLFFFGLDIEAMYAIAASIAERILKNKQSPLRFVIISLFLLGKSFTMSVSSSLIATELYQVSFIGLPTAYMQPFQYLITQRPLCKNAHHSPQIKLVSPSRLLLLMKVEVSLYLFRVGMNVSVLKYKSDRWW
jgi:hypothetical protein